jgi:Uma2 family endonuclease
MVAANPKIDTVEEYLHNEQTSPIKHEYLNGRISAMAGNSENHNLIVAHLLGILYSQLRGRPCKAYPSDMRVKVTQTNLYTYPDLSIVCGTALFDTTANNTLINPTVLIEVLSPTTENYDRGRKFEHYRSIASLRDYVLISQDRVLIEQYVRQEDDRWLLILYQTLASQVVLESVQCVISVAAVYEDLVFEAQDAPAS